MTTINAISPAYRQNMAFGSKVAEENSTDAPQKPKRHPFKAALCVPLAGSGEILNGQFGKGALHLGTEVGVLGIAGFLGFKNLPQLTKNAKLLNRFIDKKSAADGLKGIAKAAISPKVMTIMYKGLSKTTIAGMIALGVVGLTNTISSVRSAYKGKEA